MTGDPETEETLAFLRDARDLTEAEQVDAEYEALFGDEESEGEPFAAPYPIDEYRAHRDGPVVLDATKPATCEERESRRLRRIPGLLVRV